MTTHGAPDGFWDDQNDYYLEDYQNDLPPTHPMRYVFGTSMRLPFGHVILPHKEEAINLPSPSGPFPPYNPGMPPITLVYIQACGTAGTSQYFDGASFPYINNYTYLTENQSSYSFYVAFKFRKITPCAVAFWGAMNSGMTVFQARAVQFATYYEDNEENGFPSDFARIDGDPNTRLKGVYTGDSEEGGITAWYRHL